MRQSSNVCVQILASYWGERQGHGRHFAVNKGPQWVPAIVQLVIGHRFCARPIVQVDMGGARQFATVLLARKPGSL